MLLLYFVGNTNDLQGMTSAEPGRELIPLTLILLESRLAEQRIGMDLPFFKTIQNLNSASSTVHRIYKRFEEMEK